jgi:OPT family small oligopeptide transporter
MLTAPFAIPFLSTLRNVKQVAPLTGIQCYTAYGLGPLSALELYYGQKLNAGWSIVFLITTQMIGYGFSGIFRDILVRPPNMYYPGVLPNVTLFNTMHRNPSVTKKALKYFACVAICAFIYEWFPQLIFPLLSTLPLVCWFGHGDWKAFVAGSGTYGFVSSRKSMLNTYMLINPQQGILNLSLDWNYAAFFQPLYTPLWANMNGAGFSLFLCWVLYPIIYYTNTMNAQAFAPMDTGTYTVNGSTYDVTAVLGADNELNETAFALYGNPYWAPSYVFYWFWGFAALSGSLVYAFLWYGKQSFEGLRDAYQGKFNDYDDPYLKIMSYQRRVPHWWYIVLLAACASLAIAQLYEGSMQMPWWGLIVICLVSFVMTWPNGILWAVANTQIGMGMFSDLLGGFMFRGKPTAMLAAYIYGYTVLEQNLNLISDYKFGFYMKIPEREMFCGQVYGTFLGPFINYGFMQLIVKYEEPYLIGQKTSNAWDAVQSRYYYSTSIIWGVLGPKRFFGESYPWVYYSFLVGPACVVAVYIVHRWKPHWKVETKFNPTLMFNGGLCFPYYPTANLLTSFLTSITFMGILARYRPVWWRKYNYLTGVGLDCGTQLMTLVCVDLLYL